MSSRPSHAAGVSRSWTTRRQWPPAYRDRLPENIDRVSAGIKHRYQLVSSLGRAGSAQQLEPAPLIFKANEAITLYFARRYGLAIEQLQKVAELDPNFYVAYWGLGLCLEQRGGLPGAIAQFEKALALKRENDSNVLAALRHAYAMANRRSDALRVLDRLATLATKGYVPSYYAATVHIALGEQAKAMDLLEGCKDPDQFRSDPMLGGRKEILAPIRCLG